MRQTALDRRRRCQAVIPDLAVLFPNGYVHYAAGGVLIGLSVAIIYLATSQFAGASTFLESTLSYVSDLPRFNEGTILATRDWRVVFTLGIVTGALAYTVLVAGSWWTTEVEWWRLLAGGVLVGVGTRIGGGCTSGHGVCGVGSASRTSLANVATFVCIGIGTALVMQAAGYGVTP